MKETVSIPANSVGLKKKGKVYKSTESGLIVLCINDQSEFGKFECVALTKTEFFDVGHLSDYLYSPNFIEHNEPVTITPPEPEVLELTMEQIAEKFGIEVEQLKIKK